MKEIRTLPQSRSARIGGIGVIVTTAVAAATGMGANYRMEPIDWILLGLVIILGVGGTIALARLIRANPDAIGEARFDTSHSDDSAD